MIGHLDTVFAKESPCQKFVLDGDKAHGPGVVDNKGGNLVIRYAMKALAHTNQLKGKCIFVALMGDEESSIGGAKLDRQNLIKFAKKSKAALGFEWQIANKGTIARRGYTSWKLTSSATAIHSSRIFSKEVGFGSAYEQARVLNTFRKAFSDSNGLTVNPGEIVGGSSVKLKTEKDCEGYGKDNITAGIVVSEGDQRFKTQAQLKNAKVMMEKIVATPLLKTKSKIEFVDEKPAMAATPENMAIFNKYAEIAAQVGEHNITPLDASKRGAADINHVAPFVPTLGGVGVLGTGLHSVQETIDLASFPKAMLKTALLVNAISMDSYTIK
ncbi:M20/M25/M40 family metallo-hydrolase [Shewanella sp. 202IG2-18]|uniref:M20/M25/M40 family metallo-hydrolase n=1 Tax=Parashewanella hymeniacidonis TaxID=2807618 RepID=UPI001960C75E|nr:M20/M25/M40 family metallo-hydrolase [Parashewanella hymeniacidonis]MBM7071669.1 M20/M25/M40 family metallo-hydrolase [Parashewanella hymeniacidonis]